MQGKVVNGGKLVTPAFIKVVEAGAKALGAKFEAEESEEVLKLRNELKKCQEENQWLKEQIQL